MKLATLTGATRDGRLIVVSCDGTRMLAANGLSLREAIEDWAGHLPVLSALSDRLAMGEGEAFARGTALAPLPRAFQWLDASAFPSHTALMTQVMKLPVDPGLSGIPLMYQGVSDPFHAPTADVAFRSEADGIDIEGEFAVIVDAVPMGIVAADALAHVKLIVLVNDWSCRALAGREMATGFGYVQAKPPCTMAPFAVTPDELGAGWADGRVALDLDIMVRGAPFGHANGGEMMFGFGGLIAHAATTRSLSAGTIIGSGTVSNVDHARVGSSCIAEARGIETLADGAARTPFLAHGDRVHLSTRVPDGSDLFGAIDCRVVVR